MKKIILYDRTISPISLYIDIPWYIKKYKFTNIDLPKYNNKHEKKYIHHLLEDLKQETIIIPNRKINTIFIGGEIPNILNHNSIKYLLKHIKKITSVSKNTEITIECNIDKLHIKKMLNYKKSGINRFSIKINTFNNKHLRLLDKSYTSKKILNTINQTNIKKLKNVNLDITYGFPKQTLKEALLDLKMAIFLKPTHISWSEFSTEPQTKLYQNPPKLPNENIIYKIFKKGNSMLKKSGYQRYAISSYSKINYKCKHNINYWKFGDYIGIGCNAHGKVTHNNGNKIIRTIKQKNFKIFTKGNYIYKKKLYLKKNFH